MKQMKNVSKTTGLSINGAILKKIPYIEDYKLKDILPLNLFLVKAFP